MRWTQPGNYSATIHGADNGTVKACLVWPAIGGPSPGSQDKYYEMSAWSGQPLFGICTHSDCDSSSFIYPTLLSAYANLDRGTCSNEVNRCSLFRLNYRHIANESVSRVLHNTNLCFMIVSVKQINTDSKAFV